MKSTLVINEQHTLLPQQKEILEKYAPYKTLLVPATGWDKDEMDKIMQGMEGIIIFISPIPYMIKALADDAGSNRTALRASKEYPYCESGRTKTQKVLVMCNDKRVKKELPDGRIIFAVAKEGWYLA